MAGYTLPGIGAELTAAEVAADTTNAFKMRTKNERRFM
jgi:hypothetical protein